MRGGNKDQSNSSDRSLSNHTISSPQSKPGNIQSIIYGAQHPPLAHLLNNLDSQQPLKHKHGSLKNRFNDFQKSIDDAWDIVDINECLDTEKYNIKSNINYVYDDGTNFLSHTHMNINHKNNDNTILLGCHTLGQKLDIETKIEGPVLYPSLHNLKHSSNLPAPTSHRHAGPGLGKRLNAEKNYDYISDYTTNISNLRISEDKNLYRTASQFLASEQESIKMEKFSKLMSSENLDIDELIKLSWSGIHPKYRPLTWKILSHYIPTCVGRRKETLDRKRKEYFAFVVKYYPSRFEEIHKDMYRQIHIDIPRMNPLIDLFQQPTVQDMFERILYIWAMRHPASGYVQGINDLVTPFFVVFLSEYVPSGTSIDNFVIDKLSQDILKDLESDSFWCVSNLLDGIQDNYTFAQPGIQEKVNVLKHLVSRINVPLYNHLRENEVEYLQFAFRWMNNLLMREIPLKCTIRLWDTYLSETNGFSHFHLYVCVAFLNDWSDRILREKDFQGIMLLVQNLPTKNWSEKEIGMILAEAYKLKYIFADSPRHLFPTQPINHEYYNKEDKDKNSDAIC
ncbi:unnamed protein product [Gordionus sp. m RMFG-2023]|uniref:TBC1 domain family member 22B-like isoform X2 n=1 Tax=Gordionus sp. m RMFG-2023 TaxID=3053472 RepID=UPI0030E5C768